MASKLAMDGNVREVHKDALHPHRVPHVTPLGWKSNKHRRMVSVDLSPALRALAYEKQLSQAVLSNAKWAVKRYTKVAKDAGLLLANYDDRTLKQIMRTYGVRQEAMEYAVLKLRLEFAQ